MLLKSIAMEGSECNASLTQQGEGNQMPNKELVILLATVQI